MRIATSKQLLVLFPLLPLLGAPAALDAQTVSLDEGSFRLLVSGREVGTESFSIRQNGTGATAVIIARGTVSLDTAGAPEEARTTLKVEGTGLRPAAYDLVVDGGSRQRIAGQLVGGRFSAKILSPAGEQMREYLASQGAIILDDGVAHHYYFLARRFEGGRSRIPVIIPRQNRQVSAEVSEQPSATIDVGGRRIQAHHLVISPTGSPDRHLWVDDEDRVLRLEIPSRGYVARRVALPR